MGSFEVKRDYFKAFLMDLVVGNCRTRLDWTSRMPRIFFLPRDGHTAGNPLVLSHLESILLKSNSLFAASLQRLKMMNHKL